MIMLSAEEFLLNFRCVAPFSVLVNIEQKAEMLK